MILNNLKKIREKKGFSVLELAKKTGLKRDTIYKIESGKQNLAQNSIEKITQALNITTFELLGATENKMIPIKYYDIEASAGKGCFTNNENFEVINIDESQLKKMGIMSNYNSIVIINAKGNSMLPTIQDGDLLFVDTTKKEIFNDKIYIINEKNLLKVKRILMNSPFDKEITIKSDNQISGEYPPYKISIDGVENIICGQVIFYCRSIE